MIEIDFADGRTGSVEGILIADGHPMDVRSVTTIPGGMELTFDYQVKLRVEISSTGRGHEISTTVVAGRQTLNVDALGVSLGHPEASRVLVDGYHSWDWAGLRDTGQPGSGWWSALWGTPGGSRLAVRLRDIPKVGALALNWTGNGDLHVTTTGTPYQERDRTGGPTSLGVVLQPGESFTGDPIVIEEADLNGNEGVGLPPLPAGSHAPLPRQAGWMTWNVYGRDVTPTNVMAGVKLTPAGGLILLDDGWMPMHGSTPRWGDWHVRSSFGISMKEMVNRVEAKDRKLAVWLSPFHAGVYSDIARDHPEWLLRDARGNAYVDSRPGHQNYVLDASLPEVRDHLAAVGKRLGEDGVAAIKIDFLYAGAIRGQRAAGWTDIAAYRAGVEALGNGFREAAGPDARVYACGASAPALVGLVDANRSGGDGVMGVGSGATASSFDDATVRAQERNLGARATLWGSTMPPDVDAIMYGGIGKHRGVSDTVIDTWENICRRAAGPMLDSDGPGNVSRSRLRRLFRLNSKVVGTAPVPVRPVDPLAGTPTPGHLDDFFTSGGRADGPWRDGAAGLSN